MITISPIYQILHLPGFLGNKFTCNNILENFLECWKVTTLGPFQQLCHPSNLDIMKLTNKIKQEELRKVKMQSVCQIEVYFYESFTESWPVQRCTLSSWHELSRSQVLPVDQGSVLQVMAEQNSSWGHSVFDVSIQ